MKKPINSKHTGSAALRQLQIEREKASRMRWHIGVVSGLIFALVWVAMQDPRLGFGSNFEIVKTQRVSEVRETEQAAPVVEEVEPPVVALVPQPVVLPEVEDIPELVEESEPAPVVEKKSNPFGEESLLELRGLLAARDVEKKRDLELLERAMDENAFAEYREFLGKSLDPAIKASPLASDRRRYDAIYGEPALYTAFLRWHVLDKLPKDEMGAIAANPYARDWLRHILTNTDPMEQILFTVKSADDGEFVVQFLSQAWEAKPELGAKYFNLALACGVVFDRVLKFAVSEEYGEGQEVDPLERYTWYVEKNERSKLAAPVDRQSARDLVWVVCAPVPTSELEWALKKLRLNRRSWGDAYGMVEYLMERAVEGLNPYEEYTFAEILKKGGVCGDQSYFCANTARAAGIPAMILAGETDLGGHAWVALKYKPDEWTTGIGRIGGVAEGSSTNPQTESAISEQEIWLWNDKDYQRESTYLAVFRCLWLADYHASGGGDAEEAVTAVMLANKLGRSFVETWERVFAVLESKSEKAEDKGAAEILKPWEKFVFDVRRQFRENPRMAALAQNAEDKHVFPHQQIVEIRRDLARERGRLERFSGEQADLIADNLKRESLVIKARMGDAATKEISQLYDSSLRRFGGSVTGFKEMARDYYDFTKDDKEIARKAVRDIELAFKRVIETGTKDWFRAKTESAIYEMIGTFYREVGDAERADLLEKRYKRLVERAKRGAL